jgi:hypothetical protein
LAPAKGCVLVDRTKSLGRVVRIGRITLAVAVSLLQVAPKRTTECNGARAGVVTHLCGSPARPHPRGFSSHTALTRLSPTASGSLPSPIRTVDPSKIKGLEIVNDSSENRSCPFAAGYPDVPGAEAMTAAMKKDVERRLTTFRLGVPTRDVLRWATSEAAEAVGRSRRKGLLRPGADADLLVLGRSPIDDMSAVTDIRAVYRAGHRVR